MIDSVGISFSIATNVQYRSDKNFNTFYCSEKRTENVFTPNSLLYCWHIWTDVIVFGIDK